MDEAQVRDEFEREVQGALAHAVVQMVAQAEARGVAVTCVGAVVSSAWVGGVGLVEVEVHAVFGEARAPSPQTRP